jgi:hypothetical protein
LEIVGHRIAFRARTRMSQDGLQEVRPAPIMHEKEALGLRPTGAQCTASPRQTHIPGAIRVIRIILEMFHVKLFRPIRAQNLTNPKTVRGLDFVRSGDFLVR